MKIIIESIPHKQHRYPTCGDWFYDEQEPGTLEPTLRIRVSKELSVKSQELVVLHELAEVMMCNAMGITQQQVDEFDMKFEAERKDGDESEPGDSPDAPYRNQHAIATLVERAVAIHMGVNWESHEASIAHLFE